MGHLGGIALVPEVGVGVGLGPFNRLGRNVSLP